jgi:DNA-binding beta-propeller fold protein YncE
MLKLLTLLSALSFGGFAIAQEEAKPEEAAPQAAEAKADEKPAEEKPADEKPAEEKPAEAKADDKPAEEKPADDKPAEAKPEEKPAEEKPAGNEMKAKVILSDLDNPSGIAIQPETGTVFVANSGASQVIGVVNGKAEPMVTDFPVDVYGKGPKYNIGPLGLLFLDKKTLVVGDGSMPDGQELLRVFELKDDGKPVKAEEMKASFSLAEEGEVKGEGNFYALAATPDAIYVTCNGDDTKGWVSKAAFKGTEVGPFERYLATKEATQVDAPVGITVSPEGYLVVGQMGEITVPNDSLITFYDAASKEMLLNLKTNLHDITAIAYSPRKQLYVLDFAWADTTQGGLFQVLKDESSETGMRTKKIMSLDKPTAMAFDADGALYITVIGEEKKGQLIQVAPGL